MLERIKSFFLTGRSNSSDTESVTESAYLPREMILVFGTSVILALCLWFIVNLSRDFTVTLNLPMEIQDISEDMALVEDPPSGVSVGLLGEGWTLISLYSNPPRLSVDLQDSEINLYELVQLQLSSLSDVTITKVEPILLNLEVEERRSKEVPIKVRTSIHMADRFGLVGDPTVEPLMVTVSGAESRIQEIDTIYTREVVLEDVKESRSVNLELEQPASSIRLSPEYVEYRFRVTEFTEGELTIPIQIRNLPPGEAVTYNPSSVTVRYEVPIDQYTEVQSTRPFTAYVDYQTIQEDTTGMVAPEVERTDDHFNVRLRSFRPRTVTYFNVIDE